MHKCVWEKGNGCVHSRMCVCMRIWGVGEKNVHSHTSPHANKCTQKSICTDAGACTGAGGTYRSQRARPGWFPTRTIPGVRPSQLSHSRVTHGKREQIQTQLCIGDQACDALSLHKAVNYLQTNTSDLHCFGFNVGGNSESELRACVSMVLTEDEIFKRPHLLSCPGENE